LPPVELERLLAALADLVGPETEFSCECNPEDFNGALLDRLMAGGVNRLSLGLQSLDDHQLQLVGRRHDAATAREAMALAMASRLRVSVDLIIGLPGQTETTFGSTLDEVISHRPEHISLYCLELDEPVPLVDLLRDQPDLDPGEDFRATCYLKAHEMLAVAGYNGYEVSNWCLTGGECRHNLATWWGGEYLGCGPSAHSFHKGIRWGWPADLAVWGEPLMNGEQAPRLVDPRDDQSLAMEQLLLGLRTLCGITLDHPLLTERQPRLKAILDESWGEIVEGRLILRPEGWLRLDGILALLTS
jgi:oxygen-independent coproporphyrinogen III oxidase